MRRSRTLVLSLLLIPVAAALSWQARGKIEALRAKLPAEDNLLYLPPPDRLAPMSLGYKEALADLIWLRAVVFAGTGRNGEKTDWLRRYVSTINHLAPQFRRPYLWGGVVSIYSGKEITRDLLDQSVAILREGLERFPEDHELLFNLGMILFRDYEGLGTMDPATIKAYKNEGAQLIRKAAAFGAPPLIRQLAASLEVEGTEDALQAEFLKRQLVRAQDKELRRLLKHKLAQLDQGHQIEALEQAREAFLKAQQRDFPYLPLDLFAVLESPPREDY